MIPASFDYIAPSTVDEAVTALQQAGDEAKVLGGGQSLLPVLRMRLADPRVVVDLGRIPQLRGVREDGDRLVIGAMTTHHEIARDPLVREHAELIALATRTVADPQVRHRGTFGGSLAHADPAGDLPAPALVLDAEMVIAGPGGQRTVPAAEFFADFFTTALEADEVLVEIRMPKWTGWSAHYEKFNRVAQAWSMVGVAAAVLVRDGAIAEARVGLTNMGATPIRARGVEGALLGAPATAEAITAAARHAAEGTSATADASADVDYREHLAEVLTGRAVATAVGV
ncbi:MAG: xanthine dehydrogenase family protein subunit M [Saccharopolyspora sp.]|uniref:FAD binding domain-containing protein n=1 Tax=Saccharopolyspora TaxID=1835 RepID=UPI00190B2D1B|nr:MULTISPECIES: xanthine dehydrogenase family protein subunit M [unclassified Saccharopolyspora]MBK0865701.1 xanthine dehydrogenase family protein subunit M [Saccharopolyspora sp. HNM0986]MBQ6643129.1 xanthine dehydrogenase family protein subunit M [Saccharopolyspora sp.]